MPREDYDGAKIALLTGEAVVVLRRDDIPTIPFPGAVDLPGGGREGREAPIRCALRETREELGVEVPEARVTFGRVVPGILQGQMPIWFFVGRVDQALVDAMVLGDEGQAFWTEPVEAFLARTDAVPHLQRRLREYCRGAIDRGQ